MTAMLNDKGLEVKSGLHADLGAAFEDFMRAFDAFKETNDRRLGEIERSLSTDVVTTDKLARIDRALDELAHKSARPHLAGSAVRASGGLDHKTAFEGYMRRGDSHVLRGFEGKALSAGSDTDGGYVVPEETERSINRALRGISPIRAIAGVRQVSGSVYKKPFAISGPETGWVGETAARPETDSPALAELAFPTMEIYAMPAATQSLLDDAVVDIDQWIAEEVRAAFAAQEGAAFVSGDGVNKPKGFLAYPKVANATWTWGNIGTIATGTPGAFPATDPADKLIDLSYAVKAGYRANAHFVMNRATQSIVRKMKDGDGAYLWQPSAKPGEPPTLMGFPVAESEDMPDVAADSHAIAFGDFRRGYLIVDRVGIRVLRDPYSAKPYVLFYTTKRVGGGVQDFDAIKLMKFGA
ncbi:MAG: phage major capsid protein [Hyphomicrobiaceae bacterium]|nr:phage major capsid protein [Hyphomicrobiaceae bacterium]